MTTITQFQVDAFTDTVFGGNPAAVCPLDEWLPDETLAKIAMENNLAETAFFVPVSGGYHLRWFTPAVEVKLCGHATLATSHVLFSELGHAGDRIVFDTLSGKLNISKGEGGRLAMDFPVNPPEVTCPDAGPILQALGLADLPVLQCVRNEPFVLVELADQEAVLAVDPDMRALKDCTDFGVIVTAPGTNGTDFVSRMFAPAAGIDEDPVTGSSHCVLTPYWAERLGKTTLAAQQISARGGDLVCSLNGDRVVVEGQAVLFARGEIYV